MHCCALTHSHKPHMSVKCIYLDQRLAIELFRRRNSRSSSPPDHRMCQPTSSTGAPSGRDSRPGKSATVEDGSLVNGEQTKEEEEEEEEEKTQHDDSNVRRDSVEEMEVNQKRGNIYTHITDIYSGTAVY